MKRKWTVAVIVVWLVGAAVWVAAEESEHEAVAPVSEATQECLDCHESVTPTHNQRVEPRT